MNGYPLKIAGIGLRMKMWTAVAENEISDNTLVSGALKGKLGSFKVLVERYRKNAFLHARSMVGNPDDAYDLSQEAFVRAYRNLKKFDPVYPFKAWFFHILSNLCKNHLRKRKTREAVVISSEMTALAAAPRRLRPDVAFEQSEIQKMVWEGISSLPEKFKEIIMLRHFQDMSYEQIAVSLEIPRGSVMSRLYYARLKLREILKEKGVEI